MIENEILRWSNKGITIYRKVVKDYYPKENEIQLTGDEVGLAKNPFNNDHRTLQLTLEGDRYVYSDTELPDFKGGPFEFAALHYKLEGEPLHTKLMEELKMPIDKVMFLIKQDQPKTKPKPDTKSAEPTKLELPVFSYFRMPIKNVVQFKDLNIIEVYDMIRSESFRKNTGFLRKLESASEARLYKASNFNYVTFSGTFNTRKDDSLKKHSGLMAIDFDHVGDLDQLKKTLLDDPCLDTELMFVSPSGDGLKWIVSINIDELSHLENFRAIEAYLKEKYNLKIDGSGKDVSRACFLPHDPDAYINPNYYELRNPRKKFDAKAYLKDCKEIEEPKPVTANFPDSALYDVETVIQRIEESHTDITANYADWRNIGFAFAGAFPVEGRSLFHRLSRFYEGYDPAQCDTQYDACTKATKSGVSLKTFFYLAKNAGIDIATSGKRQYLPIDQDDTPKRKRIGEREPIGQGTDKDKTEGLLNTDPYRNTPRIPVSVHANLPVLLRECCDMFAQDVEKDVVLVGALTVLSGCLPNIEGIYFDKKYSPHIYTFITAPAGSGKGILNWAAYLGNEIHDSLVKQSVIAKAEYERELDRYNNLNKNHRIGMSPPLEPIRRKLFIPANCSASAFIQALADNNFRAMIFETEADTLASALKQEWGNFSDVLRKAFHHERASLYRRKDNEFIEINDPHLAILLAGTPKQVQNIMPDVENGLFSRFMYYAFDDHSKFRNPFISYTGVDMPSFFMQKGEEVKGLYHALNNLREPLRFRFTESQGEQFTMHFGNLYERNRFLLENDFNANSRRLGLITFRIAMVLTAIRLIEDGDFPKELVCSDLDFQLALQIVLTLEKHSVVVYQNLPDKKMKGIRMDFYNALPEGFTSQDFKSVASSLEIGERTAFRYINEMKKIGLLKHEHNWYSKVTTKDIDIKLLLRDKKKDDTTKQDT